MNTILNFVLELYRTARAVPPEEFSDRALGMLQTVVPFRSAVHSQARYTGRSLELYSVHPFSEPPEMLDEFVEFNCLFPITVAEVSKAPGTPQVFYAPHLYSGRELAGFRDYVRRYGHERHLLIADIEAPTSRGNWLSLYRPDEWDDFEARDQQLISDLMPHLSEAVAINRYPLFRDGLAAQPTGMGLRALVAADGKLLHCGDALFALFSCEWAQWTGARLPKPLLAGLTQHGAARIVGGAVHISACPLGDILLLTATRLSHGELQSADERAFATVDRSDIEVLIEALEGMSLAAFLCDGNGNVRALTSSAQALVTSEGPLSLANGRLQACLPGDARTLSDAIEAAAKVQRTPGASRSRTLLIGREHGDAMPVVLDVVPLRAGSQLAERGPRILIVARGSRGSDERRAAILCTAYGLTSSETEIALTVAAGIPAERIAERRGVAVGTVRSQIKTILAKIGARRQAELAARIAQL